VKRFFVAATAACLLATSVGFGAGPAAGAAAERTDRGKAFTDGRYIVTFADEPVASYDGYVRGFPATRPQPGR
jgi:hypothetical protein